MTPQQRAQQCLAVGDYEGAQRALAALTGPGQPRQRQHTDTAELVAERVRPVSLAGWGSTIEGDPLMRKQRDAALAHGAALVGAFSSSLPGEPSLVDRFAEARKAAADDRIRRLLDLAEHKKGRAKKGKKGRTAR